MISSHRKPKSNPWALGLSQTEIQEDDVKGSQLNRECEESSKGKEGNATFLLEFGNQVSFRWQNFWKPLED